MNNKMKIIIPFYNVEKWIKTCINSVKNQTFKNFDCILIDDLSNDLSYQYALESIDNDQRFLLIKNEEKCFALKNIYNGINLLNPNNEDIIITLDGDDWLSKENSLEIVNNYYLADTKTLMTYGTYIEYPTGVIPHNVTKYPEEVILYSNYRSDIWRASHLRTFKYKLWKNIKVDDLKDKNGNFYKMAWDLAFMFPMLEMAGSGAKYIDDIIYCYNVSNPINDHKVNHQLQLLLEQEIRNKKKYQCLK